MIGGKSDVQFTIGGDNSHYLQSLRDSERATVKTGDLVTKTLKTAGIAAGAGLAAATAGFYKLTQAMGEAVGLANEQEAAEAKLEAVLRATGHAAGFNAEELKRMATGFQGITTTGDEVILSGMSILATFKEVRGEGFERATKAALDMSAVMGQDLNSSIVQIGKALNDPIRGMSALSRVGVSFTEDQKELVKVLQESGDIMGAQAVILRELEGEFGGVATAMRKNFAGAVTAAGNAFGDLQEQVGFTITKNEAFIDVAAQLEGVFNNWIAAVARGQESTGDLDGAFDELIQTVDLVGQEFFEKLPSRILKTIDVLGTVTDKTVQFYEAMQTFADAAGGWGAMSELGIAGYALWGKGGPLKFIAMAATVENAMDATGNSLFDLGNKGKEAFDSWVTFFESLSDSVGGLGDIDGALLPVKETVEEIVPVLGEVTAEFNRWAGEADVAGLAAAQAYKTAGEAADDAAGEHCKANQKKLTCEEKLARETARIREKEGRAMMRENATRLRMTDELHGNLLESERAGVAERVQAIAERYKEEERLKEESNQKIIQLQEGLVNDLGRIGTGWLEDVLTGQLRTGEEMFQAFFDNIKSMAARFVSQLAVNTAIDAMFGAGVSGGITIPGLLGGGSGPISTATTGVGLASAGSTVAGWLGIGGGGAAVAGTTAAEAAFGIGTGQSVAAFEAAVASGVAEGVAASGPGYVMGTGAGSFPTYGATGGAGGLGSSALMTGVGYAALAGGVVAAVNAIVGDNFRPMDPGHGFQDLREYSGFFSRNQDNWHRYTNYNSGEEPIGYEDFIEDFTTTVTGELITMSDEAAAIVADMSEVMGAEWVGLAQSIEDTLPSMDSFVDRMAGHDVALRDSARLHQLARDAAGGSTDALNSLQTGLEAVGLSASGAQASALAMVGAIEDFNATELVIDAEVNVEVTGDADSDGNVVVTNTWHDDGSETAVQDYSSPPATSDPVYEDPSDDPGYGKSASGKSRPIIIELTADSEWLGEFVSARIKSNNAALKERARVH